MLLHINKKKRHELKYWKRKIQQEGTLKHDHYEHFYTRAFGLTRDFYRDKRVLDIGCGPRGSLEWADCAAERIGLDPLADDYLKLGADKHKMTYIKAPSDRIPFAKGYFDVVTSFNSLDHVDNLANTIGEIVRVTKGGGVFLLIVEINHPPTPTEPLTLRRGDLFGALQSGFAVERSWSCTMPVDTHDVYGSVLANRSPESEDDSAVLCARLVRNSMD